MAADDRSDYFIQCTYILRKSLHGFCQGFMFRIVYTFFTIPALVNDFRIVLLSVNERKQFYTLCFVFFPLQSSEWKVIIHMVPTDFCHILQLLPTPERPNERLFTGTSIFFSTGSLPWAFNLERGMKT